ncbi:hypothetical protein [Legionella hackeliae]|uniref:Uncharacterized protein n=1 Tax=Legionella hackeliae TaxID=449 RepID=A0A0A8UQW0_LEGHA|nr:hypothetical protein [Legionella hackeliae]CEK11260.1 protein of unknown function [Legionella hackeliae]STX48025.1 Uncharacterised protein [Legionella hackeliae]
MSIFQRLKKFYNASPENRTQILVFLGFVIVPVVGMSLLYLYVNIFWL